jgi:hypothetical protein
MAGVMVFRWMKWLLSRCNDRQLVYTPEFIIHIQHPMLLTYIRLILAMITVESNGNECAYNQKEQAAGCLQIRPIMVREANRLGIDFALADRWDCDKSVQLFFQLNAIKKRGNPEHMARCWNGGPNGHRIEATKGYWAKVQRRISNPIYVQSDPRPNIECYYFHVITVSKLRTTEQDKTRINHTNTITL